MFKKRLYYTLVMILISLSTLAADKFVTKMDSSQKTADYAKVIVFPYLFSNSVPAYKTINNHIHTILERNGCSDLSTATVDNPYVYDVFARIIGLNRYYVGVEVKVNIDCDEGHHPLQGYYHLTFDSKTGEIVDMDTEVPVQLFNPSKPKAIVNYQRELATLIYDELAATGQLRRSCYHDLTPEEAIDYIEYDYPEISGLAKRKKVVIKTSPTLENQECREILRIAYNKVSQFIRDNSVLHDWLN